ncbi:MAG: hypothetical protein R3F53_29230 [Gammaproteobacteria bacterium]
MCTHCSVGCGIYAKSKMVSGPVRNRLSTTRSIWARTAPRRFGTRARPR